MNAFHFRKAILAPSHAHAILHTVIGSISDHMIDPCDPKRSIDPKLDARLRSLACVLAFRKSNHRRTTNHRMSKFPDPGPRNPS